MVQPWSIDEFRRRSRKRLPRFVFDFIEGGAGDEVTLRANEAAFRRWALRPRVLVDVGERSTVTTVLDREISMPIMLAPTGLQRLVHRSADLEAAIAADAEGTVYVVSSGSAFTIEQIASKLSAPPWFQLYLWGDRDVSLNVIRRAKAAGCNVLMVTVDVPTVGIRERDIRSGMVLPPRLTGRNVLDAIRHPRWALHLATGPSVTFKNFEGLVPVPGGLPLIRYANDSLINPHSTWSDLAWLRELWPGKVVVKGVLCAEDAALAIECGADALVISNHGGRQLDGAPAALDALAAVVGTLPRETEIYLDGGVRRGTDVLKALALGARAVLIGRPYWHGLALDGRDGVAEVLRLLRKELDVAMALCGVTHLSPVGPELVARTDGQGLSIEVP